MIDYKKRKTLKTLSLTAGALAVSGPSLAAIVVEGNTLQNAASTAEIQVDTRLSVEKNDIEVVLTNKTSQPITLTEITPQSTRVARGVFNFDELFKEGPITLHPQRSVSVPLQRKPVAVSAMPSVNGTSLRNTLTESFAVLTDQGANVVVSIGGTAAMA